MIFKCVLYYYELKRSQHMLSDFLSSYIIFNLKLTHYINPPIFSSQCTYT